MFFKNGEAALPRRAIFPGFAPRTERTASARASTGAPPPPYDAENGVALDSVAMVKWRSLAMISTL